MNSKMDSTRRRTDLLTVGHNGTSTLTCGLEGLTARQCPLIHASVNQFIRHVVIHYLLTMILWDVSTCGLVGCYHHLEAKYFLHFQNNPGDGGNRLLWNADNGLQDYTAPKHTRPYAASSLSLPRELQISYRLVL
jgi:hypothetical protein